MEESYGMASALYFLRPLSYRCRRGRGRLFPWPLRAFEDRWWIHRGWRDYSEGCLGSARTSRIWSMRCDGAMTNFLHEGELVGRFWFCTPELSGRYTRTCGSALASGLIFSGRSGPGREAQRRQGHVTSSPSPVRYPMPSQRLPMAARCLFSANGRGRPGASGDQLGPPTMY